MQLLNGITLALAGMAAMTLATGTQAAVLDNFERDNLADNADWTLGGSGGSGNGIVDDGSGNRAMNFFESGSLTQVAKLDLGTNEIADGSTSTLFYRINVLSDASDQGTIAHLMGLSNVPTGRNSDDLQTQLVALGNLDDPDNGQWTLRVLSGPASGGFTTTDTTLDVSTWYNIWIVADNDSDTFDVYLNTGELADATAGDLIIAGAGFKENGGNTMGPGEALTTFYAHAGNTSDSQNVLIDDIAITAGESLTNPIPEPGSLALLGLGGLMMARRRRH